MALSCQGEYKRWRYRKGEGIQPHGCEKNTTEPSLWKLLKQIETGVDLRFSTARGKSSACCAHTGERKALRVIASDSSRQCSLAVAFQWRKSESYKIVDLPRKELISPALFWILQTWKRTRHGFSPHVSASWWKKKKDKDTQDCEGKRSGKYPRSPEPQGGDISLLG